uniref:Uncharacterized protein n=1 Tax=Pseudomonas phage HRDY3 TaxID=3236930 RepID=A0AB39CDR4_9VIRU
MMFYHSVSAMANNRSIIESFANAMGWSHEHGAAALAAYSTGLYLPTLDEVKALSRLPDFESEWRLALYAFHILELQRAGADLSVIAGTETVNKWARGKRLLKPVSRKRILELFAVDVDQVPEERRFTYTNEERPKVWFDQRRTQLHAPGFIWSLQQVHDTMFVVRADNRKDLLELDAALKEHGIHTMPTGDFICAVIPATSASIYYAKP